MTDEIGGSVLGVRYSEMLPVIWQADVRKDGGKDEPIPSENQNCFANYSQRLLIISRSMVKFCINRINVYLKIL